MTNKSSIPFTGCIGFILPVGENTSPLPLEHTSVNVHGMGLTASVLVTQRFNNPYTIPVELDYLFPLPDHAAVIDFEIQIGSRKINATIEELEQARQSYQEALNEGRQAALLEERAPDLFSNRIANVLPGETIITRIRYQQPLVWSDGSIEFIFPMGITPRYESPDNPVEDPASAPFTTDKQEIGKVSLQVSFDAGMDVEEIASPTHSVIIETLDHHHFSAALSADTLPDHDFILRWKPKNTTHTNFPAWVTSSGSKRTFSAVLVPSVDDADLAPVAREIIFVLDRSGSMSGEPIAQARNALRACLRALNPDDRFRILLFDDLVEWFSLEPSKPDEDTIQQADQYLASVQGRGGTEIIHAVQTALAIPPDPARQRFVVFFTDGAVHANDQVIRTMLKKLDDARLFTFGIGPSVNRALLRRMARMGRGVCEFLQLDEDIEEAILRFQDRISFPVLTHLEVSISGAQLKAIHPFPLPDLYLGQPLEITGQLSRLSATARLMLKARMGDRTVNMETELLSNPMLDDMLARNHAKACIDELIDQITLEPASEKTARKQIIELSIENRVLSPYTAFIAQDTANVVDGKSTGKVVITQLLPQHLEPAGFAPPSPMPVAPRGALLKRMTTSPRPMSLHGTVMDAFSTPRSMSSGHLGEATPIEHQDQEKSELEEILSKHSPKDYLRYLIRTQSPIGSWMDDPRLTGLILLALVRHGHTTHKGLYRMQIRKLVGWLGQQVQQLHGAERQLAAQALSELGEATGDSQITSTAAPEKHAIPAATSPLDQMIAHALNRIPLSVQDYTVDMDPLYVMACIAAGDINT